MAFHNIVLDEAITQGVVGGPAFSTTIMVTNSGYEKRNINWSVPLRKWNIGEVIDSTTKLQYLLSFYLARQGCGHSWLFKDWTDYNVAGSTDGALGNGDGTTAAFQMKKTYVDSVVNTVRTITKPRNGTVKVYVATVLKTEGVDYTVNYTTGVITFLGGHIPTLGQAIYWTGDFYYQVRFDIDQPQIQLDGPVFGSWDNIPIIEVRE